jgi:hypothetical protein
VTPKETTWLRGSHVPLLTSAAKAAVSTTGGVSALLTVRTPNRLASICARKRGSLVYTEDIQIVYTAGTIFRVKCHKLKRSARMRWTEFFQGDI